MMWLVAIAMLLVGIVLSGFFSGCETGLYRATRIRLVIDARDGGAVARGIWWMVSHPGTFIATALVGNNLANYLTSMAIVIGVEAAYDGPSYWPALLAPIALSPLVFVYGELLPKNLFYEAPNRLLRRGAGLFLAAAVLFSIPTALLWAMSKLLELISGRSPQQVRLALARKELQQVLEEGHEVGVLRSTQQGLAQGLLSMAGDNVMRLATPPARMMRVRLDMPKEDILRLCKRHRLTVIPVEEPLGPRRLIGYVRVAELVLTASDDPLPLREMAEISHDETHIGALMKMQTDAVELARVTNDDGATVGVLTLQQLTDPLLRGGS